MIVIERVDKGFACVILLLGRLNNILGGELVASRKGPGMAFHETCLPACLLGTGFASLPSCLLSCDTMFSVVGTTTDPTHDLMSTS